MFIAFGELTPVSWGLIGLAILFSVQLLLCFKAKNQAIKCVPIYIVLLGLLFSGAAYAGLFGTYSAGAISGNGIVALLLAFITAIAAAGILLAWIVYGIVRLIRRNKRP